MQPTQTQVDRTLEALADGSDPARSRVPRDTLELALRDLPRGLIDELGDGPAVRPDRLADASERLASGDIPSDTELADRIVGRLVCDRLR